MSTRSTRLSAQGGNNKTPASKNIADKNSTPKNTVTHTPNNKSTKRKGKAAKETTPKRTDTPQLKRQTSMDDYYSATTNKES